MRPYQISLSQYFGQLRPGQNYTVIEEGWDWVKVRNNGKVLFVPKNITQYPVSERVKKEEDEDEVDYGYDY